MYEKISLCLIIFLLSLTCVNAVDLKVPEHFTKIDANHYEYNDFFLSIQNYTNNSNFNMFKSDPALEYSVNPYKNNTYISHTTNEDSVFEVIEFEGKKYIIQFWSAHDVNDTNYKNLMEFNRINNLTGIKP